VQTSLPSLDPRIALADAQWVFGRFVLCTRRRRLERDGQPVRLGPRSFDLLLQLVTRAGEFVSKSELLGSVWAGVVVEEASVRVHMSMLRKALGEPDAGECHEWISSVPLRGYRFNAEARRAAASATVAAAPPNHPFPNPPAPLTEILGRDAEVQRALCLLNNYRLVTIVGAPGMGKTRLAVEVAKRVLQLQARQVAFVGLSQLCPSDEVIGTMAHSLGANPGDPDSVQAVFRRLRGRDVLLLIDNCEHVVETLVPRLAHLLDTLPGLRILATSRETLRAPGECVLRLAPLPVPATEHVTLAEAMKWPAVRLLVERAQSAGAGGFVESHGSVLARIARRLDGIPLAIELVAPNLGAQPPGELSRRLDDRSKPFAFINRTGPARHRTLAAALDWSITLLDERELHLFRKLSAIRGPFTIESALAAVGGGMAQVEIVDALLSLVNKSLIDFNSTRVAAPYSMFETIRSYAAAVLPRFALETADARLPCHAL
jgi:predicted ATPase/DNA-binding winged helix-turn-helix (wHTH) protein